MSAAARAELELDALAPLSPWRYASHLGVLVLDLDTLELSEGCRKQLLQKDPDSWSGMTLREGEITAIIVNPSHGAPRQCSTLMHELAHVILRHVPNSVQVSSSGMLLLSDYAADQEDEADWLAAALLLPRDALVLHRSRGRGAPEIAAHFCVSEQLTEWRLRMTGVDLQLRRGARG
jgi:Zn-dependent peptidase ImmA (M78 family)